jgi:hypothetical protein
MYNFPVRKYFIVMIILRLKLKRNTIDRERFLYFSSTDNDILGRGVGVRVFHGRSVPDQGGKTEGAAGSFAEKRIRPRNRRTVHS